MDVHYSSKKHDWQTPEEILEIVRRVGTIALDPATVAYENPTGATYYCARPVAGDVHCGVPANWVALDGLAEPWHPWVRTATYGEIVYCNPPYGREIPKWVAKAREEAEQSCEIVMLVPGRTDTKWYQTAQFDAKCEWRGRIKFVGAPNSAPFPSHFLYWGPAPERFREVFQPYGLVY